MDVLRFFRHNVGKASFSCRQLPVAQFEALAARFPGPARARTSLRISASASESTAVPTPPSGGVSQGEAALAAAPREDDPVLGKRQETKAAWTPPKPSLGDQLVDILYVFGGLLDRPFGSGQSIAAAGAVVVERVRAEVNAALPQGRAGAAGVAGPGAMPVMSGPLSAASPQEEQRKVQVCFEILRLVQLLALDLEMMRAAVREETLLPRLEAAKARCKDAMALARQL